MKTNAIRIIESKKIPFTAAEYAYDEDDLNAVSVAKAINAPPETVFKTLVARNEKNENLVFVIPGDFELNLKKAAAASSSKRVEMLKVKELLPATGDIFGADAPPSA